MVRVLLPLLVAAATAEDESARAAAAANARTGAPGMMGAPGSMGSPGGLPGMMAGVPSAMGQMPMPAGGAAEPNQMIEMMFHMLDKDQDGHVTKDEMLRAGDTLGPGFPQVPNERVEQGFSMMDHDEDGKVNKQVRRNRRRATRPPIGAELLSGRRTRRRRSASCSR